MFYALGVITGVFIGWVWAMCHVAAKVEPKPPRRECWHIDENGPYYN